MPNFQYKDGSGTLRTVLRAQVKDGGGTVRLLQRIRVMVGGTIRTVFTYLTVALNRELVSGSYNGSSPAAQDISTSAVTATVSGGTGPYTYLWSAVGTPSYTWVITNGTTATAYFTGQSIPNGTDDTNAFVCTVTDAALNVVVSEVVVGTVANNSTA